MRFLRAFCGFCGALMARLCGFCGVLLTWRVLLMFPVDVKKKSLFRYGRDMADHQTPRLLNWLHHITHSAAIDLGREARGET